MKRRQEAAEAAEREKREREAAEAAAAAAHDAVDRADTPQEQPQPQGETAIPYQRLSERDEYRRARFVVQFDVG